MDTWSALLLAFVFISTILVPLPIFAQTVTCQGLAVTIAGTGGSDVITGTEGSDVISGKGGDDVINGLAGDDVICGNGGNDTINGNAGNDSVYGGGGDDNLNGNYGDDALFGGNGSDSIDGGPGVDKCKGESLVSCNDSPNEDPDGDDEPDPNGNPPPSTDTTPPTVSITSPSNGATVSGSITISTTASDNIGVTKVEFYLDGVLMGSDNTNGYAISLDTNAVSNGSHTLTAKAYDAANNVGNSAISVNVNNSLTDTIPPTVSWLSPTDGSAISGITLLRLDVRDNAGIWYVQVYINGGFLDIAKNPAGNEIYIAGINTTIFANGSYNLQAVAFDLSGNKSVAEITVIINN
ncbi:MAG: Ig-like domain-containing protein [Thermodesulfobacteriota bacterium]